MHRSGVSIKAEMSTMRPMASLILCAGRESWGLTNVFRLLEVGAYANVDELGVGDPRGVPTFLLAFAVTKLVEDFLWSAIGWDKGPKYSGIAAW